MKSKLYVLSVAIALSIASFAFGQTCNNHTVTATITDTASQLWTNGTFTVTNTNPSGGQRPVCRNTGVPITLNYSGSLNSSGVLTISLPDTTAIDPSIQWVFTIQSNTSASPSVMVPISLTADVDLTSQFSAQAIPPSLFGNSYPALHAYTHAYSDAEVLGIEGAMYLRSTDGHLRNYHAGAWQDTGGGGGGGACGPASGDATSTDCGTNNNTGSTYSGPPNTLQTYGVNNMDGVTGGSNGVVYGNDNGTNIDAFSNTTMIGLFNLDDTTPGSNTDDGNESVFVGYGNAYEFEGSHAHFNDATALGARNFQIQNGNGDGSYTNAVALGFQNLEIFNANVVASSYRDAVAIGDATADDIHSAQDIIAIGDGSLSGSHFNPGATYTDVIAIGDVAASLPPTGSSTLIAIGLCPMCIGDTGGGITGPLSESIAIGDEAMNGAANDAHDLIAIGDGAMNGPHGLSTYQSGNDSIAIGNFAGAAFRAGNENIAIGTNACAVGFGSTDGNGNTDGNEQICIGDNAGQSVPSTTHLNNIIVIGHNAQASQSNSIRIGDSSMQTGGDTKIYFQKIALAMPTGALAANTCTSVTTQAYNGLDSLSTFTTGFASVTAAISAPGWGTNGGLVLMVSPNATPANGFDWAVCNQSSSSITMSALTINVGAN